MAARMFSLLGMFELSAPALEIMNGRMAICAESVTTTIARCDIAAPWLDRHNARQGADVAVLIATHRLGRRSSATRWRTSAPRGCASIAGRDPMK